MKTSLVKLCDAYGVLGNLRYTSSQGVLHYLVLVTGCVSVGKLDTSEVGLLVSYHTGIMILLMQVYKITDCKLLSLRGYAPDEEKVSEVFTDKNNCEEQHSSSEGTRLPLTNKMATRGLKMAGGVLSAMQNKFLI